MLTTTLNRFRHDPDLPRLAAALVLIVMVQVLLSPQAHSRMEQTADGWAFEVCIWGDTTDHADQDRPARQDAALWFSQLMADLPTGAQQQQTAVVGLTDNPSHSRKINRYSSATIGANAIRGPPLA